ncbi:MAG: copper amine oxidase N-terminal domain-containing protein [Clostridia bacterium]|nr:copper amine oxidase N-terminal domain-containing protein [Clostridia bacterium]
MKKAIAILLTLVLSMAVLLPVSAEEAPIKLTVNGAEVVCDVPPQIVEDRTLVPLRAAFEALGAVIILWDESTSTVHAQAPSGDVISLQIGSNKLFMANNVIEMDVPAKIIGDRTMVPIRAIAESIGCTVEWLPESREVQITK